MSRPVSYTGPSQSALADVDEDISMDEEEIDDLNPPHKPSIVQNTNASAGPPTGMKQRRIRPASYGGTTTTSFGAITTDSHSVSDLTRFLHRTNSATPHASYNGLSSSSAGNSPVASPSMSRSSIHFSVAGASRGKTNLKESTGPATSSDSPGNLRKAGRSRTLDSAFHQASNVVATSVEGLQGRSSTGLSSGASAPQNRSEFGSRVYGRERSGLGGFLEETSGLNSLHSKSLNQVPAITTAAAVATANMVISQSSASNLNLGPTMKNSNSAARMSLVKRDDASVNNNLTRSDSDSPGKSGLDTVDPVSPGLNTSSQGVIVTDAASPEPLSPHSNSLSSAAATAAAAATIGRSLSGIMRKEESGSDSPRVVASLSASASALPTTVTLAITSPPQDNQGPNPNSRDLSYTQHSTNYSGRRYSGIGNSNFTYRGRTSSNTNRTEIVENGEGNGSHFGGVSGSLLPEQQSFSSSSKLKRQGSRRESLLNVVSSVRAHFQSMPAVPSSPQTQTLEEQPESKQPVNSSPTVEPSSIEGTPLKRQWSLFNVGRKDSNGVEERKFDTIQPGQAISQQDIQHANQSQRNMTTMLSQTQSSPAAAPIQHIFAGIKKRTNHYIVSPTVFSVGLSLQNTEMSAELKGIADLLTLSFLDSEVEDSFRSYFVRSYMPMWRLGLLIELVFGSILFIYHMMVYPSESDEFLQLENTRLRLFPDFTSWSSISCVPGFVCERCVKNRLCNDFSPLYETLFFGLSLVLPNLALYILSYQLGPLTKLSRYTHTISILHTLIICSLMISARHYVVEASTSSYTSAALYLFFLFESAIIFRIRFINLVLSAPIFVAVFTAESISSFRQTQTGTPSSVIISIVMIVCGIFIICLGSYDYERSMRSHFVRSRMYMRTTAKLMDQLKDLNRNYSDQIADFDSPLEKAIAMVKGIRTDPGLVREHFESLGVVLALLNSSDLMTPDIERQVEGGRVALDEEGEAWLFTNLYRGRVRGNSKTNPNRRRSNAMPMVAEGNIGAQTGTGIEFQSNSSAHAAILPRQVSFSSQSTNDINTQKGLSTNSEFRRKKSSVEEEQRSHSHSVQMRKESIASIAVSGINQHLQFQHIKISVAESDAHVPRLAQSSSMEASSLGFSATVPNPNQYPPVQGLPAIMSEASLDVKFASHAPLPTNQSTSLSSSFSVPLAGAVQATAGGVATGIQKALPPASSSLNDSDEWDSITELNAHLQMVSLLEKVDHWNWDIFDLTTISKHRPLFTLSHYLFLKADLYSKFQIVPEIFLTFLTRIEAGYRIDVPYHNSVHATDVLHGVAWLRDRCLEMVEPSDLETLAIFLAAIVHDFDHPGRNNNFLINTSDPKAVLYNDRSVLENHHVSSAFQVLMAPECNFISHLPRDDYKQIREIVIELVLATDLQTQHFVILSMFKNKVSLTKTFDPEGVLEDRNLLFKMMIKCADVSNPTKAMYLYEQWTKRVLDEFFMQGDAEKSYGIPVSPYYDRETDFTTIGLIG
ncbi:High affinity cAMP-specific 3',5'-cyclic phosphodiesterase 7A [Phlyctochytrium planicorne]|nr:High affinity cAMP-specific 3',5'-cyclic phosphodiesterase 7A [Phlyctochytrium planicorne]